jgi:nucleoside-diphosphate-sugar epimerase
VVLGGTGAIGFALARRLPTTGWRIVVTGRNPEHVPGSLDPTMVRFIRAERHDPDSLAAVLGEGADLLVDCACYTAGDAAQLLPLLGDVASTVMISSKAVYVDAKGRHSNSSEPPVFGAPITEEQPTLRPNGTAYDSAEGYGPNKVAAEETLLDSGHPVTVLRPSKVHGAWSRQPREWHVVRRVLDRRPAVLLARQGAGADHPSAALNIAALIETVAELPGRRVLNVADPDCPSGREIASTIAGHLGHSWREVLLDDAAPTGLGAHPWDRVPPVKLDTTAAERLGHTPVGTYAGTVPDVVDWLVDLASRAGSPLHRFLTPLSGADDYRAEDAYLRDHP